jgi:GT2 family glycosyltransferase
MRGILRPRIAVLLAAHNRRAMTVRALDSLLSAAPYFDLTIVLLDDGSTDGTAEAAIDVWPTVTIINGNGNCFWNGGMHRAWSHALGLGVDGYFWLNDDVLLDADAMARLAQQWHAQGGAKYPFILVGATRDDAGRRVPSPLALKFERLPISEELQTAETFNGNIVLISVATQKKIGINDDQFLHSLGDIDYGLRATRAGIPVLVMPGTLGRCNNNAPIAYNTGTLPDRIRRITSHRGIPVRNWWRITRRYSGIWMPLHFLLPYRKIF